MTKKDESLEMILGKVVSREQLSDNGYRIYDVWKDGTTIYKKDDIVYVCDPVKEVRYTVLLRLPAEDYKREGSGL